MTRSYSSSIDHGWLATLAAIAGVISSTISIPTVHPHSLPRLPAGRIAGMSDATPSSDDKPTSYTCRFCGEEAKLHVTKIEGGKAVVLHVCLNHSFKTMPEYEDMTDEEFELLGF